MHMTKFRFAILVAAALISACSKAEKTEHYLIDTPAITQHLPNRLGRVSVQNVTLPQYASGQEIAFQTADGALHSRPDQIWADDPAHAITGFLATQISQISGATAIAEPWPFNDGPDRRLEVRIARMLAGSDGNFLLYGQYFVTSDQGNGGDLAKNFEIVVPINGVGPGSTATAQSEALQKLALEISALAG
jgi:uncharacterized lipoprotein YmbA